MRINNYLLMYTLGLVLMLANCKKSDEPDPQPQPEQINLSACDNGIALTDSSGSHAARAIDLCREVSSSSAWGIVSARYIKANGVTASHSIQAGITGSFGSVVKPRKGDNMLVLSTGHARHNTQPGACGSHSCAVSGQGIPPTGFPQPVAGCPVNTNIADDFGFEVKLWVPSSAQGFYVDHMFFTFDYPEWVCQPFNDQFIIQVFPEPSGSVNGNVALDGAGNPVGVNSLFLSPNDSALMAGTGFGLWNDAATTGWLRTYVPVTPGTEITVRFIIYDIGDQNFDSTVLVDNFIWVTTPVVMKTVKL